MNKSIYLDYAAATPMDPNVLEAMNIYLTDDFYNPSATYLAGRSVRKNIDGIRNRTAVVLGTKSSEIIFTAGATEANNIAIQGVLNLYPSGEVLVSAVEHESVSEPAKLFSSKLIPVNNQGVIEVDSLETIISDRTVLISIMLINNELGTIQPIGVIAKLLQKIREDRQNNNNQTPLYLHTDAAQAGNYLDLNVGRLGIDLMSINGGKIYGPKQSGVLYVKAGTKIRSLIVGGGQEFGLRSGTENVAATAGLTYALEDASRKRKSETKRISEIREFFENKLVEKIPSAIINGSKARRAPHITSLTIPGVDNERLMMELDERGIQCAVGSACSASRDEASHVLSAIGLSEDEARSTLRLSFGRESSENDVHRIVENMADLTASNR